MDDQDLSDEQRLSRLYSAGVSERQVGDRAACVPPEAILAVILGESPEADRLTTLYLVLSCPAGHRDYEHLSAVEETGTKLERIAERRDAPWRRLIPLAAAASIVLAVGTLIVMDRPGTAGDGAERGGGREIALYAPGGEVAMSDPVAFAWTPVPGASRYVLEVLGPDGAVIFSDSTADTSATLAPSGTLVPGTTYRWSVRTLEEGADEPAASPVGRFRAAGR